MGGGGIALFDCDNDGKLDIAVVNDSTIDQFRKGGDLMITLYRQDGNSPAIHFTDITKTSGLSTRGWGMAIAIGDYDNDGLPDIYVTGYSHNVLYHNLGNCKFEDVTAKAGVQAAGFSTGAAWADYDHDGHLDLFVARYVKTDVNHLRIRRAVSVATGECLSNCLTTWRAKPTFYFGIAVMALSKTYPKKRE